MYWIYIRSDDSICNSQKYYVGVTKRLYTRQWDHDRGECKNTLEFDCHRIIALYKLDNMATFFDYNIDYNNIGCISKNMLNNWNNRTVDPDIYAQKTANFITEWMMLGKDDGEYVHDFKNIRGGKYVRFDCEYKFPVNDYIKNLPLCHCDLPCDVRKRDGNNYLFFRCPKKNFYSNFRDEFGIKDEPCSFYQKYIPRTTLDWLKNVPSHKSLSPDKKFTAYCIAHDVINEEKIRKEEGEYYEDWREEGGRYTDCRYYKEGDMVECNKGIARAICYECCKKYKYELGKIFTDITKEKF